MKVLNCQKWKAKKAQNFVPNDFSVIQDVKKLSTLMSFSLQKSAIPSKELVFSSSQQIHFIT